MSHISDILTGVENTLTDTFPTAHTWQREPLDEDWDRSVVNIWVFPESIEPDEQPFVVDFRKYNIAIVLKFRVDGRASSHSATDTVQDNKGGYSDDVKEALQHCLPNGIHSISNVYHVEYTGEATEFGEEAPQFNTMTANEFGMQLVFTFYTYENEILLLTEAGSFLVAEDGDKLIAG